MTIIPNDPSADMTRSDDAPDEAQLAKRLEKFGVTPGTPAAETFEFLFRADDIAAAQRPIEIPPCPAWCVVPAGHGYDSVDYDDSTVLETRDVTFMRDHESSTSSPFVSQRERWHGGEVTLGEPEIFGAADERSDPRTPKEARDRAFALLEVAAQLEVITLAASA